MKSWIFFLCFSIQISRQVGTWKLSKIIEASLNQPLPNKLKKTNPILYNTKVFKPQNEVFSKVYNEMNHLGLFECVQYWLTTNLLLFKITIEWLCFEGIYSYSITQSTMVHVYCCWNALHFKMTPNGILNVWNI